MSEGGITADRASLPRVFFDANSGDAIGYWVHFETSLEDLKKIPDIYEGKRVLLYMPDELEVEARLSGTENMERVVAVPIDGTWRVLGNENEG